MYQAVDKLYLKDSILSISNIDDKLVALDSSYYFYKYDLENKKFIKNKQLIDKEPIYKFIKSNRVHSNGLLTLTTKDSSKVMLFKHTKDKMSSISEFSNHISKVEVCSIYNDKYLATGGEDGRVYLYDLKYTKLLSEILIRPDFISSIVFSDDGKYIFCSSFDREVSIYSINTAKILKQFSVDDVVEDAIFLDNRVFFVLRDGTSYIFDLKQMDIVSKNFNTLEGWATKICSLTDRYALVATRSDTLYIFDSEKNYIKFSIILESSDMSSLYVSNSNIFIGFSNGELLVIDYKYMLQEFSIAIKLKDFAKAKSLIDMNQFLLISSEMELFDKSWNSIFDKAKMLIIDQNIDEAVALAKPFMFDSKRESEFYGYLNNRDKIVSFLRLVEQKNYVQAMKIAQMHRFLQNLPLYQKIENQWEATFNKAKLLLEKDPTQRQNAISMLQPYNAIESKKDIIANMVNNTHIFTKVEWLVKNKNFGGYFEYVNKYSFLRDTLLYRKVVSLANRLYEDMLKKFKSDDLSGVLEVSSVLKLFEPFEHKALEYERLAKVKKEFIKAVESNDQKRCFQFLSKYSFLQHSNSYRKIIVDFEVKIDRAKELAYIGDVKGVESILEDYIKIDYTLDKVAQVYQIAYVYELEKEYEIATTSKSDLKLVLENYIQRFGKDALILSMTKSLCIESILDEIDDTNIIGYKKLGLVSSIFNVSL
jgi:hypothetical protein